MAYIFKNPGELYMKKINDLYIDIVSDTTGDTFITAYSITPTTSVYHIGSGYLIGVEASYSPFPFISFGIRSGYLNS